MKAEHKTMLHPFPKKTETGVRRTPIPLSPTSFPKGGDPGPRGRGQAPGNPGAAASWHFCYKGMCAASRVARERQL